MLGDPRFLTLFPSVFLASLVLMAVMQSALTHIGSRLGAEDLRLDAVWAVEGKVRSPGLLLAGTRARLWWVARLFPVVLAAAGLVSAVGGDRRGADLTIMLVVLAIPLFWMLFGRSSPHNRPTPLGRAVLHRLQQRYRVNALGNVEEAHGRTGRDTVGTSHEGRPTWDRSSPCSCRPHSVSSCSGSA